MAESVDALVSNTSGATRAGSTPALGTGRKSSLAITIAGDFCFMKAFYTAFIDSVKGARLFLRKMPRLEPQIYFFARLKLRLYSSVTQRYKQTGAMYFYNAPVSVSSFMLQVFNL